MDNEFLGGGGDILSRPYTPESEKFLLIYLISSLVDLSLNDVEMDYKNENKIITDILFLYRKHESKDFFFMIFDSLREDNLISLCNFAYLLSLDGR